MIIEFKDQNGLVAHKELQEWRQKYPEGFYLALRTYTKATLHGATSCMHPGDVYWMPEDTKESRACMHPGDVYWMPEDTKESRGAASSLT
jgi:hypothetical protein